MVQEPRFLLYAGNTLLHDATTWSYYSLNNALDIIRVLAPDAEIRIIESRLMGDAVLNPRSWNPHSLSQLLEAEPDAPSIGEFLTER